MRQTLRREGEAFVITVPDVFVEQNRLEEGSQVELFMNGEQLTVTVQNRRRYKLDELLAEMPEGKLPAVSGWDEMEAVGKERL
jgi:antitoxin component of MazEF toxin-antitoxin module